VDPLGKQSEPFFDGYDDEAQFFVLSTNAPFLIIEIAPARSRNIESWIKP
jgi:hypothetical protein